jgi:DNA-binding transcriptional regulator YiaG
MRGGHGVKEGSKYYPLHQYLRQSGQPEVTITLAEIEALIGKLPASARSSRGWWGNRGPGAAQALAWMNAGYHTVVIDLAAQRITFRKPKMTYQTQRTGNTVVWNSESIKSLRAHMGFSQSELAEELGVRQQTISEWETGMYQPKRALSKLLTIVAERAGFLYVGKDE